MGIELGSGRISVRAKRVRVRVRTEFKTRHNQTRQDKTRYDTMRHDMTR